MSIRKSVIALALAVPFASAFSMDLAIAKSIPLKDGSMVIPPINQRPEK